jgi:hypothetical protein
VRLRAYPWWERCDVVGHATEIPCQFCVRAHQRQGHLKQKQIFIFESTVEMHVTFLDLSADRRSQWLTRLSKMLMLGELNQ